MSSGSVSRATNKNLNKAKRGSTQYGLRSLSESSASTHKNNTHETPLKSQKTLQATIPSTPTPSPGICVVCEGSTELRSLKFKDAVIEFTDKIEAFKQLTKSFTDNTSILNDAIDTKINESFTIIDNRLNSLLSEVACLPNITYLENRLEILETKLSHMSGLCAKLDRIHDEFPSMTKIHSRIDALENRLSDLASTSNIPIVLDDKLADLNKYIEKLNSFEESVDNRIRNMASPNSHYDMTESISKLESLCTQLNRKFDLTNTHCNSPLPQTLAPNNVTNHSSFTCAPNPKTCLILGDSNTKYIKLDDEQIASHRIPTYLIEDIDPNLCAGYKKIWIHVGINNMKSIRCSNTNDIHHHFNNLMHKLNIIRSICPHSKIIVSPIPPTAIQALNRRSVIFNRLLFSQDKFFTTLNFNLFCGPDGKLMNIYRCYNNQDDKIHFGSLGIKILTSKIRHCISLLDHRSYASAAKQYQ